jgi:hypothetical protein
MFMQAFTEKITTKNSETYLPVSKQILNIKKLPKTFVVLCSATVPADKSLFFCKDL